MILKRCVPTLLGVAATVAGLSSCADEVSGNPASASRSVASPVSSGSASVPATGTDLQAVALPTDEVRRIMNDATLVKTATWRHAVAGLGVTFTPPECSVVAANGLHAALDGTGQTGIYYVNYVSPASPMVQVGEGVVGFPDPVAAHAFIVAQQEVWQQCANTDLSMTMLDQTATQHSNELKVDGDKLSMSFAMAAGNTCIRTLSARKNVAIDDLVCSTDPAEAATAIENGMLDKIPH